MSSIDHADDVQVRLIWWHAAIGDSLPVARPSGPPGQASPIVGVPARPEEARIGLRARCASWAHDRRERRRLYSSYRPGVDSE